MLENLKKYITPFKFHKENIISRCILAMLKKSMNSDFVEEFCKCVIDAPGDLISDIREYLTEEIICNPHMEDVFNSKNIYECMCDWCKVDCINPVVYLILSCFFEKGDLKIFSTAGFTPYLIQDIVTDAYIDDYPFTATYKDFIEKTIAPSYDFEFNEDGSIDDTYFSGDAAIIGIKLLNKDKMEEFTDVMENLLDLSEDDSGWYCLDTWENQHGILLSYYDAWKKLEEYLNYMDDIRDDIMFDRVAAQFEDDSDVAYLIDEIMAAKSSLKEVLF